MSQIASILRMILVALLALPVVSCATPPQATATTRPATRPSPVTDLDRQPADPFAGAATHRATVLIFVSDMCPISNSYAPEIRRLHDAYEPQGIAFRLVYPDPSLAPRDARNHYRAFSFNCPAYLDPKQVLTRRAEATVTPEAAVYLPTGQRVYLGRIDDRWMAFAKARYAPTTHDLKDVLDAIVHDQPVTPKANKPVGCPISD